MNACFAVLSAFALAALGAAQDPQGTEPQQQEKKEAAPEKAVDTQLPRATIQLLREQNMALRGRIEVARQPLEAVIRGNEVQFARLARRVAFVNGMPPPDSYTAKVPEARDALSEIEESLQAARAAGDLEAALEALNRMERAIMKTRAALHDAGGAKEKEKEAGASTDK